MWLNTGAHIQVGSYSVNPDSDGLRSRITYICIHADRMYVSLSFVFVCVDVNGMIQVWSIGTKTDI